MTEDQAIDWARDLAEKYNLGVSAHVYLEIKLIEFVRQDRSWEFIQAWTDSLIELVDSVRWFREFDKP